MSPIRVFVSFDIEHDRELYNRLLAESKASGSEFPVSGRSERVVSTDNTWTERMHGRIRDADQVIVICGEHTYAATGVSAELRIARDEEIPYFLLHGRKNKTCKKPASAKSTDKIYKWTWEILKQLIGGAR